MTAGDAKVADARELDVADSGADGNARKRVLTPTELEARMSRYRKLLDKLSPEERQRMIEFYRKLKNL